MSAYSESKIMWNYMSGTDGVLMQALVVFFLGLHHAVSPDIRAGQMSA